MKKQSSKYVDGFVLTVPKKKLANYRKMARNAGKVYMEHGALSYKECMLDDSKPKGITFYFSKMAKAKPNETVWFTYIEYKSKRHRNAVNKKVVNDPFFHSDVINLTKKMPFDLKRLSFGGFKVIVDAL